MSAQRILASGAAALLVLIVLAIVTHSDKSSPAGGQTTTLPPTAPGTLRVHDAAGNVTLDGPVHDGGEKSALENAAASRFGKGNVVSNLTVQASSESVVWVATAMTALPRKGGGYGPIDLVVSKTVLSLSGRVPTAAAGRDLVKAVQDASGRKLTARKIEIVSGGAGGLLQRNIDDAVNGRAVSFETGSAAITKAGQTVLKALVTPLKAARGSVRVVIGGYTDDVGDAKANLRLSRARANSVRVFLLKRGVSAKRMIARGYGEAKPIASNKTAAGRSKNRRIEFTVLGG
jgi:outer membrane protein OmpA-like peptidoglycan-associated protein